MTIRHKDTPPIALIGCFLMLVQSAAAGNDQLDPVFVDQKFKVETTRGLVYAKGLSRDGKTMDLTLDVYEPTSDSRQRQPAMILLHGGGLRVGNSAVKPMVQAAWYFASRGWVCFSINYRLTKDRGMFPAQWKRNRPSYSATRDAKAAVRWIRANAEKYRIDADQITAYGGSAGAYLALALGISDEKDYRDELSLIQDPTLKTTNLGQSSKVQAVVNFWGAPLMVDNLELIDGRRRYDRADAPVITFHGTKDARVDYQNAVRLKKIYDELGLPLELHTLDAAHAVWQEKIDNKPMNHWAARFIARHLKLTVIDNTRGGD